LVAEEATYGRKLIAENQNHYRASSEECLQPSFGAAKM